MVCEFSWQHIPELSVLITTLNSSICIISIIRLVAIKRLNLNSDVTYDIVLDDICTSLEPTLGIINACLPVLQPVLSKLSGSTIFSWSKWKSSRRTSRGWLGSKKTPIELSNESKSGKFHRLPADLYPLTDVTATAQSHCCGPAQQTASDRDVDSWNDEFDHRPGIKVKQRVGVISTEAPRS